jgi:excisionase family DNA binding protein
MILAESYNEGRTMAESDARLLGITEAAKQLGIHPKTQRAWVDKGHVPAVKLPSGYRRFTPEQIAAIKDQLGMGRAAP